MFKKYMHVERFGNEEVEGIELGECYVFPKLDGTNAQLWWDQEHGLQAGSRNRHLTTDNDNAGFYNWALGQECFKEFFRFHPDLRLYGEFLVPHSLKTYEDYAWKKFYVFDVEKRMEGIPDDDVNFGFIKYEDYAPFMKSFDIDWIPPVSIIRSATYDHLLKEMQESKFLIKDGHGCGEGIVIKNYDYQNRFGRTCWAKMITNAFKEKHTKETGATVKQFKEMVEQQIVESYVTGHLVDKTYAKIVNEAQGWSSRHIPQLLNTVYYDLVKEEMWEVVKKLKNPTINFKTLNTLSIMRVKELRPELF